MINIGDTFGPWIVTRSQVADGLQAWYLTDQRVVIKIIDSNTEGDPAAGCLIGRKGDNGHLLLDRRDFPNLAAALEALKPVSDDPPEPWCFVKHEPECDWRAATDFYKAAIHGATGTTYVIDVEVNTHQWIPSQSRGWECLADQIKVSEALTALGKWCQAKRNAYVVQP